MKKSISLRKKLIFMFTPLFLVVILTFFIVNYFITKKNINRMVHKQLNQLSTSLVIQFKTIINHSVKNSIKYMAEEKKRFFNHFHQMYKRNKINLKHAKRIMAESLKDDKFKRNLYYLVIPNQISNSKVKPVFSNEQNLSTEQLENFLLIAKKKIRGYFTTRIVSKGVAKKFSVYFTYTKRWNWFLFSLYQNDNVIELIDLNSISEGLLSLEIEKNGYVAVMDFYGNLLIHPWNENENILDQKDAYGKPIFKQMIQDKNGFIEYDWEYGQGVKRSILYYRTIPELKLIVYISTIVENHYQLLNQIKKMILLVLVILIMIIIPVILSISTTLSHPLEQAIQLLRSMKIKKKFKNLNLEGYQEVNELSNSFNHLIDQVQKYHEELQEEISERRRIEFELRKSQSRFETIIETVNEGFVELNNYFEIIDVNPELCKIFEMEKDELIGRSILEIVHKDSRSIIQDQAEINEQDKKNIFEIKILKSNHQVAFLLFKTSPRFDEARKKIGSFVMITDISQLKKSEQKIKNSLKEKEMLIREVHHRVKNNLQVIIGILSLEEFRSQSSDVIEILSNCRSRVQAIAAVHKQLYQDENLGYVSMNGFLKTLIHEFKNIHPLLTESIQLDFYSDVFRSSLDQAIPIGLIVNELLTNSMKHAFIDKQKKNKIEVKILKKKNIIQVIVCDNGKGIPKNFNIKSLDSLGLQFVQTLVKQLSGKLEMKNNNGSWFKIEYVKVD